MKNIVNKSITEDLILQACKIYSNFYSIKSLEWTRVKNDIYVCKLSKEQIGFMNLLVRYPKLECKAEVENGIINFNFYLLWKLKDQKKLDYFNIGNITYNIEKAKFGKFNVFLKITK